MPVKKANILTAKPDNRTVFQWSKEKPYGVFIRGHGPTTYICGVCRKVLVQNVYHGQVRNIVFRCPHCNAYNEIP